MFHLEAVEAFAIDTDDGTLRNECRGVGIVDNLEDLCTLATLRQHKQHFHFLAGIEAMSIDHGATAVALVDASANLLIMIADDEELYASTHGIDDLVDTERRDIKHYIAIDDALPILQHEVGTGDDNQARPDV